MMNRERIARELLRLAKSIVSDEDDWGNKQVSLNEANISEGFHIVERKFSDDDSLCTIGFANIHAATDVSKNKRNIEKAIRSFKEHGVNVAIFPEFCLSSYFWEDEKTCWPYMDTAVIDLQEDWLKDTIEPMLDDTLKIVVLNNIRNGPDVRPYYNSTIVVNKAFDYLDPKWIYDKTFLPGIENTYTVSGETDRLVLDTEWGRFGFSTCYDFCFSQLYQEMAMVDEVDMVIQVASWRGPAIRDYPSMNQYTNHYYGDQWDILMPAVALQNQMWVASVNACGVHDVSGAKFWGGSGLWAPSGVKMVQLGREPELLVVHNVDIQGERKNEKDDFDFSEDFEKVYDIIDGRRAFTRL